ncbi:helix-turn-helix domain-containing protein [Cytobacillus firmus]|uniref:helix-turn-helix domain-containing protein n=1 Tax=Bacillaceae TaxID=186817 RepID=UPI0020A110C7|nr:helix-turn-helix domain-containing protein [Priestia flexa]MCP1190826.1 helix-turn-helix domain-containing protein [Priestia flexa]
MERTLNTEEALKILKDCYITDSVQTLRKWIREGKIIAAGSPYKQEGYTIKEEDLKAFIEEERPGLLEILKVYHQVNDRIPTGISAIVNQRKLDIPDKKIRTTTEVKEIQEMEQSDETATIFEMLLELEQEIKELDLKLEVIKKDKNENLERMMEDKLRQVKSDILARLNNQTNVTKDRTEKKTRSGNHGAKTENEFVAFFRKEFWNSNPANEKLKGEDNKKFKEEARNAYSYFYNDDGRFRDEDLKSETGEYELQLMINNQEAIITGQNRKEVMNKYFKIVILPKIQNGEKAFKENPGELINPENKETESIEPGDGYVEELDLSGLLKSSPNEKAET